MGNWTIWDWAGLGESGGDRSSRRGNIGRWRTGWNSGQNGNWDTTEAADESPLSSLRMEYVNYPLEYTWLYWPPCPSTPPVDPPIPTEKRLLM
jgi:hypothetical protein